MFLGLDLGTSALKALLLDEAQRIVASADETLAVSAPAPLWREQDPADWWDATDRALQRLQAQQPAAMAAVRGIGLSGQMHGAVLLDAAEAVLRPAILWNDGRSSAECAALEAELPALRAIAGNLAMPGFTAPKLRWVRTHEPEVFARVRRVLLPKDWLRLQLSGQAVSEMSDASGTLWLDVAQRRWSAPLLAACGLDEAFMPRLVEGSEVSATLRPALAQRWGLRAGVPIAGGGGDNAASAVGLGVIEAGQGLVSLGTSGVIFLAGDRFRPNPAQAVHAFCHALPARWHQMSVMLAAASALRWAVRLTGSADEAALVAAAEALPLSRRAAAPIFLPYLNGERTPHNDARAQGALVGLSSSHEAADIGWAVLEGVGLGLLDGWRAMGAVPGEVRSLSLVGGGSRSAAWATLLATLLDLPLTTHTGGEAGGALGAARLGWLAAGGSLGEVCTVPPVHRRFEPQASLAAVVLPRHARFRALYPALREGFHAAA